MTARTHSRLHRRSGQTLIIAMIVLGILLALGTVFLGLINRGIINAGNAQKRSLATDLAEAGIRFAHKQLIDSDEFADWRPTPNPTGNAQDPDYSYMQAGGPDGLGAYTRVTYSNGRALIRVRYQPSDVNTFAGGGQVNGSLRTPGKARGFLVIESVGRSGFVSANDPTTFTKFEKAEDRKMIAFASIGLIDQARFITNKYNVSRPADLGAPSGLGASIAHNAGSIDVAPETVIGNSDLLYAATNPNGAPFGPFGYGGGIRVNGDLAIHGTLRTQLNRWLGDQILVAGAVRGADDNARLIASIYDWTGASYGPPIIQAFQNATNPSLDSRGAFNTFGVFRDGVSGVDQNGLARGVRRLEPPSAFRSDSQSGESPYLRITRESGALTAYGNTGKFGYGQNVFVDNGSDRQIRTSEDGRMDQGTSEALVYDWLNPNNGKAGSGWRGPFYVPAGAFMNLLNDGFVITLNSQSANPTWKRPDGSDTGASSNRYKVGLGTDGRVHIVSGFTPGVNISAPLTPADYDLGQPFGGVVYFDGNVRVRGTIPTDLQLNVVSNGTIYVEGSITKGIRGNDITGNVGVVLTRPSRSMLMLMAREYVAVNTTGFLGAAPGQDLQPKSNSSLTGVRVQAAAGTLNLQSELLLDQFAGGAVDPTNPSTWLPFSLTYAPAGGGAPMSQMLLLQHASDDSGNNPATFVSLDVNYGLDNPATAGTPPFDSNYLFELTLDNAVRGWVGATFTEPGHTTAGFSNIYGLGEKPWQRFSRFETQSFPLFTNGWTYNAASATMASTAATPQGSYMGLLQDTNSFTFRPNNIAAAASDDYLVGRAAIVPQDVRIEASMFAEEGSFFVIPGPGFNSNPNDRRDVYEANVAAYIGNGLSAAQARDAADTDRLNNYGSYPSNPFYGEPLDVRVVVVGSVSENMPPPISQQAEWIRNWGWIPRVQGAERTGAGTDREIPLSHFPDRANPGANPDYVPNLLITYDPALATARPVGFDRGANGNAYIRVNANGQSLAPIPKLPVSPTLSYFGEVNP